MTSQELINAAGRLLGELRGDRSFGVVESAQLLVSLNNLLSSWSEEQFAIHQMTRETLAMSGAASYTFGPTGSLATSRPIRIDQAATINSASVRMPAKIVTAGEWAAGNPDDTATGDFVEMLHPDYASPLMTMRVYPKANSGSTLELFSLKPLTALASLATTVAFPDGYEQALVYGFAVKIAPEFGRKPSEEVVAIAEKARAAIAATNGQLYPAAPAAAA